MDKQLTDKQELQSILGIMLLECFPDMSKEIIKSLRLMTASIKEILNTHNLKEDHENEFMQVIADSFVFIALKANIDIEENNINE